jgi:hypothetical protein
LTIAPDRCPEISVAQNAVKGKLAGIAQNDRRTPVVKGRAALKHREKNCANTARQQ